MQGWEWQYCVMCWPLFKPLVLGDYHMAALLPVLLFEQKFISLQVIFQPDNSSIGVSTDLL